MYRRGARGVQRGSHLFFGTNVGFGYLLVDSGLSGTDAIIGARHRQRRLGSMRMFKTSNLSSFIPNRASRHGRQVE